jgi:hypothetical protein
MSTHRPPRCQQGRRVARKRRDWFADDARRSCTGGRGWAGQHIELGIADGARERLMQHI